MHLLGNSLGGTVRRCVAATRPDLVRTLTLVSPALPVLRPRLTNVHLPALAVPWAGQRLARRLGRFPVEQRVRATIALCWADPSRVPPRRFDEAMEEAERRARLDHDGDAMLRSLRSLMAAYLRPTGGRCGGWPPGCRRPRCSSTGSRTGWSTRGPPAARRGRFPGSRLVVLPDSGHVSQMEHPEWSRARSAGCSTQLPSSLS